MACHGQDKKLVRVTLIHASAEYRPDLNRMLDIHKLRLENAGSAIPEDADIEGYDDAWLPEWKKVRETLLSTYLGDAEVAVCGYGHEDTAINVVYMVWITVT